jgi:hypothetical protein
MGKALRKLFRSAICTFLLVPTVSIVHGQASAATSTFTASPVVVPTGGTTTLTIQLKDAGGNNNITGWASVNFVSTGAGSIGTITENSNVSMEGRAAGVYWLRADNHSKPFILE